MNTDKFIREMEDSNLLKTEAAGIDPAPDVEGGSPRKNQLLNIAYKNLPQDECYLEVGTWQGKSLISAVYNNTPRITFACDNFSQFKFAEDMEMTFKRNVEKFIPEFTFFNDDFRNILNENKITAPVGVYFYDAAHDFDSQYSAIRLIEPLLAEEALVIIDDWQEELDPVGFHAKTATLKAIDKSQHKWEMIYNLKANHWGDTEGWWCGVGVWKFNSRSSGG